ncbi:hypothetical protein CC1G_07663 [Coprinopsis cinerea okayama7|uniref:GDP/GTP exchange factor Sec2 N-terminal domain-containing protein n=1 Tax=Coprinopsis cinerea (strain Okayama-7 / 130 / ATCC MYA-4618 / FGSC 9003) TaxID=240176 RepID=A8NC59_COPC7|nr:hypothetical protein CC1G_07663 [Coprinopsis cinerea okayama7\|eukprot:XP_001832403.1 hypothetical protein CC1G_07663 [Coprinopsis cinerea okayama7\
MPEDPDIPPPILNGDSSPQPPTASTTTTDNDQDAPKSPTAPTHKPQTHSVDRDAQEMVITSLRAQIQDLFSQVTELNNKLVKSYDRVSDLEDDLHVASANLRTSSVRISQLEMERTQHLAALNTGLLVEKSHVTTELNRLMEKATEEAAQRGQAESARAAIEKDLDDLSASLFDQANTMVAEARFAQHLSEQKVVEAERALKGAEEAVSIMQAQMQALQAEKEEAEKKTNEMQVKMGKGKWLERIQSVDLSKPIKLLSSHVPYQEFLLFVAHLRSLHQTSPGPPAMTTILPLPFLARLSNEDSDPTLRLDLAPSLNWLSRRSVLSAIHTGQLTIEPISVSSLLSESTLYSSPVTVAGLSSNNDSVSCALCGSTITTVSEYLQHRAQRPTHTQNTSWSGSFFKKARAASITSHSSRPPSPTHSISQIGNGSTTQSQSQQVYIFRVAQQQTTSTISSSLHIPTSIAKSLSQGSIPSTSSTPYLTPMGGSPSTSMAGTQTPNTSPNNNQPITIYPLCSSGWCLKRLRSTCTLWAYVRTGIVEKVWEEEIPTIATAPPASGTGTASSTPSSTPTDTKPPLPPRKRGLWGFATAIGERAVSWSESDKDKKAKAAAAASAPQDPPPLPPRRGSAVAPPATMRRLPPPPPPIETSAAPPAPVANGVPPPLPKRSEGRKRTPPSKTGDLPEDGGATHQVEDGAAPSTPHKLIFDAADPQSPIRASRGNTEGEGADPTTNATAATSSAPPHAEPPVVNGTAASEKDGDASTEAAKPAVDSTLTPASPVRPNRFSLPRSVPLPDSRPDTPIDATADPKATNGTVAPPSRTASPATPSTPTGTAGPPPPIPRRAAARRPVPAPPPSRPVTPQQAGGEAKAQEDAKKDVVVDGGEKKDGETDGEKPKVDEEAKEDSEATAVVEGEAKEKESIDSGDASALPSTTTLADKDEESKKDAESTLPDPAVPASDSTPAVQLEEPEAKLTGTPASEGDSDVFVDALSSTTTKETLAVPSGSEQDGGGSSEPSVSVEEESAASEAKADGAVGSGSPTSEDKKSDEEVPEAASATGDATPEAKEKEKDDNAPPQLVEEQPKDLPPPPVEEPESKTVSPAEDKEDADPNDKEVYIGEATWEERTWKELVRLREDMFWARIGGLRG